MSSRISEPSLCLTLPAHGWSPIPPGARVNSEGRGRSRRGGKQSGEGLRCYCSVCCLFKRVGYCIWVCLIMRKQTRTANGIWTQIPVLSIPELKHHSTLLYTRKEGAKSASPAGLQAPAAKLKQVSSRRELQISMQEIQQNKTKEMPERFAQFNYKISLSIYISFYPIQTHTPSSLFNER